MGSIHHESRENRDSRLRAAVGAAMGVTGVRGERVRSGLREYAISRVKIETVPLAAGTGVCPIKPCGTIRMVVTPGGASASSAPLPQACPGEILARVDKPAACGGSMGDGLKTAWTQDTPGMEAAAEPGRVNDLSPRCRVLESRHEEQGGVRFSGHSTDQNLVMSQEFNSFRSCYPGVRPDRGAGGEGCGDAPGSALPCGGALTRTLPTARAAGWKGGSHLIRVVRVVGSMPQKTYGDMVGAGRVAGPRGRRFELSLQGRKRPVYQRC